MSRRGLVLFVHGAGEQAHAEDQALATYLGNAVAPEYSVRYPRFSGLENVAYGVWKDEVAAELETFGDPNIVVAHSLGGAAVLKYLAQERRDLSLAGLFLIGAPCTCATGEWGEDFALSADFASTLPMIGAIVMYHSEDDEWVPFSHLARWAEKFPGARARRFTDRGHSFCTPAFAELIDDIRSLVRDGA
jgi:predicted alpha/beta hydrolase family esterase